MSVSESEYDSDEIYLESNSSVYDSDSSNNSEDSLKDIKKNARKYAQSLTIKQLVKELEKYNEAYHNSPKPLVTDKQYDDMLDILKEKDPKNAFLKKIGSSIRNSADKVDLPYTMASLNKIKPGTKELSKWFKKYDGPYEVSDKLDGASCLLFKDSHGKITLYSRGDSVEARDITHLTKYIFDDIDFEKIPNDTAIRGEIIATKKDFEKYGSNFKTARNMIIGLTITKKIDTNVAKIARFVGYSILHPRYKQSEQFKLIEKYGFECVNHKTFENKDNIDEQTDELVKYYMHRRQYGKYEIDGLVVTDDNKKYKLADENPDYSMAFKMDLDDQIAETKIVKVIWNATKYNVLQPKVEIEPVNLGGTEITYATAYNAKYIYDNNIGPGTIIKIVRSGDVIPKILEIVKASKKPQMPDVKYKWNETEVNIILDEDNEEINDSINIKQMQHFFKTLDIKYISEGILTKMYDAGYTSIFKIFDASDRELTKIDGVGDKMVTKIRKEISDKILKADLATIMASSMTFDQGLGKRKLQLIVDKYPDIMKRKYDDDEDFIDDIIKVDGYARKSAVNFVENIGGFKKFYKELNKYYDLSHIETKKKTSGSKFKDNIIVFTGFRDQKLKDYIEDNGGKVTDSVSKKTTVVIHAGDTGSSKYTKAIQLKIPIYTKPEFMKKYNVDI